MLDLSSIGILTAFAAGAISFLSPCVLPLVPAYVSYVAGESLNGPERAASPAAKLPALGLSVFFVLGFSCLARVPPRWDSCCSDIATRRISLAARSSSSSGCS